MDDTSTRTPHPDPRRPAGGSDTVVDKVRKLLAMAEGSRNAHEADAFSRKAAELIAVHRLDPERLRAPTPGDDLAVRTFAMGRGAYVRARIALLQAIAEANGCRLVFAPDRAGTVAFVAGFTSDLESTELLYTSLHAQASARLSGERRATGAATQQWRRAFLFGYAAEAEQMHAQSRSVAERVDRTGTVLPMLRARDQRVDEFSRLSFGRVVTARRPSAASATGWAAGRDEARRSDVGRRSVDTRRAIGPGR
jgi:hypothetical protein